MKPTLTTAETPPAPTLATPSLSRRQMDFDVFRGLLITHMAFDHASLMFNAGRAHEEIAGAAAPVFGDLWQFIARFSGVPVAPAFFFMAGFMVAITSLSRAQRGVARSEVTRQLMVRGLVLIAADALVMGLPRALMGFYSFAVLSSIGVALILLAVLRHLPTRWLLLPALAVLALHPLLDLSTWPVVVQAVLSEPVRTGGFRSLYPVIPWCAVTLVGYVVGRDATTRTGPERLWWVLGGLSLLLFFAVRLHGGYGNGYPTAPPNTQQFWLFAKYPPDLPFLTWALAGTFAGLAVTRALVRRRALGPLLRVLAVYGRVPFFFYLLHFYVLGIGSALLQTKIGLAETALVWLLLLAVTYPACVWYHAKKRDRPNIVTRYL